MSTAKIIFDAMAEKVNRFFSALSLAIAIYCYFRSYDFTVYESLKVARSLFIDSLLNKMGY